MKIYYSVWCNILQLKDELGIDGFFPVISNEVEMPESYLSSVVVAAAGVVVVVVVLAMEVAIIRDRFIFMSHILSVFI